MNRVISLCIPAHARTYDLKKTMPHLIAAVNASPPVEIVILDYNSPDDLEEYIGIIKETTQLTDGNVISYVKYSGRDYYHTAHAHNLAIRASTGEYIIIFTTDIFLFEDFIKAVREMLDDGYVWMYAKSGTVVCQRQELIDAGGYDERFEFYSPMDKDLHARLVRRGGKVGILPRGLMDVIRTPNADKIKNFRLKISKREMSKRMKPIYEENNRDLVLVANQGQEWGQF